MAPELRVPALEVRQTDSRVLYSFAVDGKALHQFAAVSRIRRGEERDIQGYQRPEVLRHIDEIKRYLESDNPMLPNSLVVAFDKRVRFDPTSNGTNGNGFVRFGCLVIPVDSGDQDADKVGWVVDGQQRAAAIRDADVERFPVFVTAFVADSVDEQRSQFILVNSTKPLPKGLVYELLPSAEGMLPTALDRRRFPAQLLARLNFDDDSPLKGMIQTPTCGGGVIKDNSILKMLENSIGNGALYYHRDPASGEVDEESMVEVLKQYWGGVSIVFQDAWNLPPRRSRLMHGAGIVSMGLVMDAIHYRFQGSDGVSRDDFASELRLIEPVCRWTSGSWEFSPEVTRAWNDVQNTPRDIQLLSDYLLAQYKQRVTVASIP